MWWNNGEKNACVVECGNKGNFNGKKNEIQVFFYVFCFWVEAWGGNGE